jgi:type I restriction-modification system DNA methylase subunit
MKRLLNSLYEILDFESGSLLSATEEPTASVKSNDWLEKGEWLSAAKRAGAEKVFFVENNPVAVFAECGVDHVEKAKAFNRIWSLARPRLLFLASSGEISVIDLAQEPLDIAKIKQSNSPLDSELKTLKTIKSIGEITQLLQNFHRDNIESGKVFGDSLFGDLKNRADKALMHDLKTVRRELIQAGLSLKYAHALIGRSIFIRYLEDRKILTPDDFQRIARQTAGCTELLRTQSSRAGFDFSECKALYPRVLENKDFTYALFRMLPKDFNGDMFPDVDDEENAVKQIHLDRIQELLYGDVGIQKKLFFYSYQFDIIPLDLISSIYEEFYHTLIADDEKKSKARQDGAYYTPPVLAGFVLSQTLTAKELKKKPRVLDPACGSGIFLVEAFRRMVRHEWHKQKERPSFECLKQILQDQIAGIEINEEAARITAFSLYLAMLNYLDPPSIKTQIDQGKKLPNLLVKPESKSPNHIHCIWVGNTFDEDKIESTPLLKKRFGKDSFDIVVGNPPWGSPGNKADEERKDQEKVMLEWCRTNNRPIGDKEPSQAFLWRALDFLKEGGKAGMLVSAGVLFKHSTTTQSFRKQWMGSVRLDEVFNFTHVRTFFFKAISPFALVCFIKDKQNGYPVRYWSAKQTAIISYSQAILLSKNDLAVIRESNLFDYRIWKVLDQANYKDLGFILHLANLSKVSALNDHIACSCVGFKEGNKKDDADWLGDFNKVKNEKFDRYNVLGKADFELPPSKVEHRGKSREIYEGKRIIIKEGLRQSDELYGRVIARYETKSYAYNHSLHAILLKDKQDWKYKLILGILWSSFARYYLFLTSANWGVWHDKVLINERLQLPVVIDKDHKATERIITIVDKLRNYQPKEKNIMQPYGVPESEIKAQLSSWETELDDAVFELYSLNEEQKDLIKDCCEVTLPFFYKPFDSIGAMPAVQNADLSWIENYTRIFARRWNAYLGNDTEMRAEVHTGAHGNMIAVEFFPADKTDPWDLTPQNQSWNHFLDQISNSLPQPMGISQILMDGVVHAISNESIIIIKRNEKRFWTRSLAREDAEATLCKRMINFKPGDGGRG